MKRLVCFLLCVTLLLPAAFAASAAPEVPAPSIILMDRASGTVLAEKNADEKLAIASITKVMTLLLTVEAVDSGRIGLEDKVTVSREAMGMGGSTAYLAEGEQYTVHELLKAVTIQSANDGAYALAEFLAGTHDSFVQRMNERAHELGMTNTYFTNATGLDSADGCSTARDVSVMSRQLLGHPLIKNYTTIWMDSLRDGTFTLSNTNRLVRFYDGATGLKTGSTSKAGACVSASAERGGMELIAVVLKASTGDERFESARKLLDFGFASFRPIAVVPDELPAPVPVLMGKALEVQPLLQEDRQLVVEKEQAAQLTREVVMAENVEAPVLKGQKLGELTIRSGDQVLATVPFVAAEDVARLTWWDIFAQMVGTLFMRQGSD